MGKKILVNETQLASLIKKVIKEAKVLPNTSGEHGYNLDDYSEQYYSSNTTSGNKKSTVSDAMLMKAKNIEKNIERLGMGASVTVNNHTENTGSHYSESSITSAVFNITLYSNKLDPSVYKYLGNLGAEIVDCEASYSAGEDWSNGSVILMFKEEIEDYYNNDRDETSTTTGRKDNRYTPRGKNELGMKEF